MPVINSIANAKDEMSAWRHELHQNPQTCYEEEFASNFVKQKLTEWGIPFKDGIAVTGIVATIEGQSTSSGKSIGLRADMDALDITEKTNLPHASKTTGKMHACGHDGHTSTLLGVARHLNETKNFNGTVYLIFQPAEEGGAGAHRMMAEGLFKDFPMDAVYGYHNWPMEPKGKIGMRAGPLMACSDRVNISVTGKGGHAAMPHMTIDPMIVSAHIITALQSIVSRNVDPIDQAVISITNMNCGTGAENIIADTAEITGSIRAFTEETRRLLEKRIPEICENVAKAFGAEASAEYVRGYDPTINSAAETDICTTVARELVGEDNVDTGTPPCMGAEDFGAFLTEKPGCYIFMGQGEADEKSPHNQSLHSPYYDYNNEILPLAASYFAKLVEKTLPTE